jgi:hypothetical protein
VKGRKESGLDFIVDQLTNSIQNVVTGDTFATRIGMKTKKKELSVDYSGGQGSLTLAEEQELHDYFTKQKVDSKKSKSKASPKKTKQTKVSA